VQEREKSTESTTVTNLNVKSERIGVQGGKKGAVVLEKCYIKTEVEARGTIKGDYQSIHKRI